MRFNIKLYLSLSLVLHCIVAIAQGDGPRNLTWGPKGVTALIPKWMNLEQNISPANSLEVDANFNIDLYPITLIHNFNVGGNFAQVLLNVTPGSGIAQINSLPPEIPSQATANGFADGFVGFKYGLVNTPALNVLEFMDYQQKIFSMHLYTRLWYSGSYDKQKLLNLGTNRVSFDIGPVVNLQLSKDLKRPTILESYAALRIYGTNNEPSLGTFASESKQCLSFIWENHLSHNFTEKFFGAATLRYQYGGEVELDNVKQDNGINMLGCGATIGYKVLSMLALHVGYGGILWGSNDEKSDMFRVTAFISYANLKKLQKTNN